MRGRARLIWFFALSLCLGCSTGGEPSPPLIDSGPDAGDALPDSDLQCDPLTPSGSSCVDLSTHPANCGACGRTCVIPNATPSCSASECTILMCDPGFYDHDGDPDNGCEFEDLCMDGAACTTECASQGTTTCEMGMASCIPPVELCNGVDDNCDEACDEGALPGCRIAMHRYLGNGHVYSTDAFPVSASTEEAHNYFYLYAATVPETRPVYLCQKSDGKYFLTSDTACEMNGARRHQLGFWSSEPR